MKNAPDKKYVIITIDGPAASGKSTVAQALAHKLGYYYLYTGLLYRAVAYILMQQQHHQIVPEDLSFIQQIGYEYQEGKPHIFYNGFDITSFLYDASLDQEASKVSARADVRDALLALQRAVATRYNIIADGRDCGTVVFPDADAKFFLTADVRTRALRVLHDKKRSSAQLTLDQIEQTLIERDNRDKARAVAPLTVPDDAVIIDNSAMTTDQTLGAFLDVLGKKGL